MLGKSMYFSILKFLIRSLFSNDAIFDNKYFINLWKVADCIGDKNSSFILEQAIFISNDLIKYKVVY